MRVLIDAARDEAGDVLASQGGAKECRCGLYARIKYAPYVGAVVEAEDRLGSGESDLLRHLKSERVEVVDVLGIEEDLRLARIEAERDDVKQVLVRHPPGVVQRQPLIEQELLVVGQLEVQRNVEHVLEMLGEQPGHEVAQVGLARRTPSSIQVERLACIVAVQDPIHVAVRVHHPAAHQRVYRAVLRHPVYQRLIYALGSKLLDEQIVIDLSADLPGSDCE